MVDKIDMYENQLNLQLINLKNKLNDIMTCSMCGKTTETNICEYCGNRTNTKVKSRQAVIEWLQDCNPIVGEIEKIDQQCAINWVNTIQKIFKGYIGGEKRDG